jgi:hypothetical protein
MASNGMFPLITSTHGTWPDMIMINTVPCLFDSGHYDGVIATW